MCAIAIIIIIIIKLFSSLCSFHVHIFSCVHLYFLCRYLGGRSEDISQREKLGSDMAFGGGGLVLSRGVLSVGGYVDALQVCYEQIQWLTTPGGDWVLHRCLSRLGIPLTASPGKVERDKERIYIYVCV
jgi:hypothetical protein